jgi:hypothetical protein
MGSRRGGGGVDIPIRPEHELCISNGDGTASCFDNRPNPHNYIRQIVVRDIVTNNIDNAEQDKWLKFVLDSCRGK